MSSLIPHARKTGLRSGQVGDLWPEMGSALAE